MSFSGKIRLYVFFLIAVIPMFSVVVGYVVFSRQNEQIKWAAHLSDFHIATLREISIIQLELLRLKDLSLAGKPGDLRNADEMAKAESRLRKKHRIRGLLFFISEKTGLVLKLHQNIEEEEFSFMIDKVRSSFSEFSTRIRNSFQNNLPFSQREIDTIEEFLTSLEQLKRLHSITYKDGLTNLSASKRQENWVLAIVVSIAMVLGMFLIWRLMAQIAIAISLKEKAEQEIVDLNSDLEKRVEDKTRKLQEAQTELLKKEKLAALGQLTAVVSHELRNPLGTMKIAIHLIEKSFPMDAPPIKRAFSRLNRSLDRCDQIIEEMLDFTRIKDLAREQVGIDDWLREVLEDQEVPEGIDLKIELGMPGLVLPVDPNRLRRAVINVVENACHAIKEKNGANGAGSLGHVAVTTRIAGERAEICISDSGPGIPPEALEKIFEPLFSTKSFGVGLGLPIVREILAQHDGGIEIESGQGHGARFVLWIPIPQERSEPT